MCILLIKTSFDRDTRIATQSRMLSEQDNWTSSLYRNCWIARVQESYSTRADFSASDGGKATQCNGNRLARKARTFLMSRRPTRISATKPVKAREPFRGAWRAFSFLTLPSLASQAIDQVISKYSRISSSAELYGGVSLERRKVQSIQCVLASSHTAV